MIRSEQRFQRQPAPNVSSDEEHEEVAKRFGQLEMRPVDGNNDTKKHPDFLRLDHYEIDNGDELVADDEFFNDQHTPSRPSISPVGKMERVEQVGLDKTPIMLMMQMNRLSVNYFILK
jgi:hypothetical protein